MTRENAREKLACLLAGKQHVLFKTGEVQSHLHGACLHNSPRQLSSVPLYHQMKAEKIMELEQTSKREKDLERYVVKMSSF